MSNPVLLRLAFWVGVVGFVASLAVHLATFLDVPVPGSAMALHVGVFVAFVPVMFALKAWSERRGYASGDIRRLWPFYKERLECLPVGQKVALAVLFVYAMVNFQLGFVAVMGSPDAGLNVRMFSGHWMIFYAVSAVFARLFLKDLQQQEASPSAMSE